MSSQGERHGTGPEDKHDGVRDAADDALGHLRAAQAELDKAHKWDLLDLLGGGAYSSIVKREKLQKANDEIKAAQEATRGLSRELQGTGAGAGTDMQLELDDFWSLGEIPLDNFYSSLKMQERIEEAQKRVGQAIEQVKAVRDSLD